MKIESLSSNAVSRTELHPLSTEGLNTEGQRALRQGEGTASQRSVHRLSDSGRSSELPPLHQSDESESSLENGTESGAKRDGVGPRLTRSDERQFHGRRFDSGSLPQTQTQHEVSGHLPARSEGKRYDPASIDRILRSEDDGASIAGFSGRFDRSSSSGSSSRTESDRFSASEEGSLSESSRVGSDSMRVQVGSQRFDTQESQLDDMLDIKSASTRVQISGSNRHDPVEEAASSLPRSTEKSNPESSFSLDKKGLLKFSEREPEGVRKLLQLTVGKPGQVYQALHTNRDESQHHLLEKSGRLIHWGVSDLGAVALHTSKPLAGGRDVNSLSLDGKNNELVLHSESDGDRRHGLPSDAIKAHLTGTHRDKSGNIMRLHGGKLHQLGEGDAWHKKSNESFSALGSQQNKRIYAVQQNNTLMDLTRDQAVTRLPEGIRSHSVDNKDRVALLSRQGGQDRITLLNPAEGTANSTTKSYALSIPASNPALGHTKAESIIQAGEGRLLVADAEGRAFLAQPSDDGSDELSLQLLSQDGLTEAFGGKQKITGWLASSSGEISALVKDGKGQTHSYPMDGHLVDGRSVDGRSVEESGTRFHPSWNLSDALIIENRKGLEINPPEAHQVHDMGRHGVHHLKEGVLYHQDPVSKSWQETSKGVKGVQQGLDGQGFALQDGKIKKMSNGAAYASGSEVVSHGKDNLFSLPYLKRTPVIAAPLHGQKENVNYQAMAVIDPNRYVGVDDSGRMTFHQMRPSTDKAQSPPQSIPDTGLDGKAVQISVDKEHNLYALTDKNTLFQMNKEGWELPPNRRENVQWQPIALPEGEQVVQLGLSADQKLRLMTQTDTKVWKDEQWQPETSSQSDYSKHTLYETLKKDDTKLKKLGAKGMTVALEASYGNIKNRDGNVKSRLRDVFKAHVFEPSLTVPRPLKAIGNNLQHSWQGRDGLKSVYEAEKDVFQLLKSLSAQRTTSLGSGEDGSISSRITGVERELSGDMSSALNALFGVDAASEADSAGVSPMSSAVDQLELGEEGQGLVEVMRNLRDEISTSAERQARLLAGHHQVAGDYAGAPDKPTVVSRGKDFLRQMSLNQSGANLTKELLSVWRQTPDRTDSKTLELLKAFEQQDVKVSRQKMHVPLGQQRDASDSMALSKARLALDALALNRLNDLVEKAERLPYSPDKDTLDALSNEVYELKNDFYGDSPVKVYTDMGFTNHRSLEQDYDAIKSFLKAFQKEEHGVSVTSRTVFGTKSQQEMTDRLATAVSQLDLEETISIRRAYGGGLGSAGVMHTDEASKEETKAGFKGDILGFLSVGHDKSLNMKFTRTIEDNNQITVSFEKQGITKATPSFYIGGNAYELDAGPVGAVRAAGTLSLTAQYSAVDGISFNLSNQEAADFIRGLSRGEVTATDIMKQGQQHLIKSGHKWSASVDANITVEIRANLANIKEVDLGEHFYPRVALALGVDLNLVSVSGAKSKLEGYTGERVEQVGDHKPRFFNSGSVGLNAQAAFTESQTKEEGTTSKEVTPASDTLLFPFSESAGFSASFSDTISKTARVELRMANKPTSSEVAAQIDSLQNQFSDEVTQRFLESVGAQGDDNKILHDLSRYFAPFTEEGQDINEDQYQALESLRSLTMKSDSHEKQTPMIYEAGFDMSYSNPGRLDNPSWMNQLLSAVNPDRQPVLAQRINQFAQEDPNFQSLLKTLQSGVNSSAVVEMELTDKAKAEVDQALLSESMTTDGLANFIASGDKRRIAAVTVYESRSKTEGVALPLLVASASSSATVGMTTKLGTARFTYGQDQNTPTGYRLEGNVAEVSKDLASAFNSVGESKLAISKSI